MKKTLTVLAATAAITLSAIAFPGQAEARWGGWHGGWRHGGWGGPFIGGLAAGALLGGAYAYGPRYYGYYGPGPYAYDGGCYTRRVWTPWGWRWRRYCY